VLDWIIGAKKFSHFFWRRISSEMKLSAPLVTALLLACVAAVGHADMIGQPRMIERGT